MARRPVHVLVAYADIPSARESLARLGRELQLRDAAFELHPMLWRFDQLHDPRWRETALLDAARTDTVVFAMRDTAAFCPGTEAWLDELLARRRGSRLQVMAMVGTDETWTITLSRSCPSGGSVTRPAPAPQDVFGAIAPKVVAGRAA